MAEQKGEASETLIAATYKYVRLDRPLVQSKRHDHDLEVKADIRANGDAAPGCGGCKFCALFLDSLWKRLSVALHM